MYPADLCGSVRKKGSRGEAIKSMLRLAPNDEQMLKIELSLQAQVIHDRKAKEAGEDIYRWPFASTYINQRRFDDELSYIPEEEKKTADICSEAGCTEEVHGPAYKFCGKHLPYENPHRAYMIEAMKRNGVMKSNSETLEEWGERCRQFCFDQKLW